MKEDKLLTDEESFKIRIGGVRDEVTYFNSDGKIIENSLEYFKNIKKNSIVSEKLNVGDVIKVKYIDDKCVVEVVDYLENNIHSDYLIRTETGQKFLIGQEDILEVIDSKIKTK